MPRARPKPSCKRSKARRGLLFSDRAAPTSANPRSRDTTRRSRRGRSWLPSAAPRVSRSTCRAVKNYRAAKCSAIPRSRARAAARRRTSARQAQRASKHFSWSPRSVARTPPSRSSPAQTARPVGRTVSRLRRSRGHERTALVGHDHKPIFALQRLDQRRLFVAVVRRRRAQCGYRKLELAARCAATRGCPHARRPIFRRQYGKVSRFDCGVQD